MDKNKNFSKKNENEDSTKYGEFVCSEYHWLSPEEQKENANKLENITKTEEIKKNKKKN